MLTMGICKECGKEKIIRILDSMCQLCKAHERALKRRIAEAKEKFDVK